MTTKNGLPCNFIISFIQDKEKRWWLYTRCGVVEFSDSELQRWWANPDTIVQNRVYDAFDGAQPNDRFFQSGRLLSRWARVVCQRSCRADGGSVQALAKGSPAQTYIESVIVDRKEFAATRDLEACRRTPRDLQIDYTSPTFLIPQKVNFRYRLDGYDHDWHDAGTRRQAFYTDLPPGKYSFRVIASNSDGVWNDNPAKLDFSIAPAYYQTNGSGSLWWSFFLPCSGRPINFVSGNCDTVRDDVRSASERAHTDSARTTRHSAAKLSGSAAEVSVGVKTAASPSR